MGTRSLAYIGALVILLRLYLSSQNQIHTTTSSALLRDTMAAKNIVVIGGSYVGKPTTVDGAAQSPNTNSKSQVQMSQSSLREQPKDASASS